MGIYLEDGVAEYEEDIFIQEDQLKIRKAQARFLHEVTGENYEDLIILLYKNNKDIKNKLSIAINSYIADIEDKNISLILENMYSLSGNSVPLSFSEIKLKYLGKIPSISKEGGALDYRTISHLSAEGIKQIKMCFARDLAKQPPKDHTKKSKKANQSQNDKPKTEKISQMSVEDQIENIRIARKLLNSLGIIDNEKIRLFAKSISPKEFSVFCDLHPLYDNLVLSMSELQTRYNLSAENIWEISDKVLKKLYKIAGVTIPQVRLSNQSKKEKDKKSFALSYNIYVEKILAKYNINDINVTYAISNRVDKKKLAIYLQLVPLSFKKPLTIEEVLSLNGIDILELKKIVNEIIQLFSELAKIEIKCPEIILKEVMVVEEKVQDPKNNNYSIIEKVLLIHGVVNPELVKKILEKLSDKECLVLSLLYEKNMSLYELTFELKISYTWATDIVGRIKKKFSDEFGIKLSKIKRSKVAEKHDLSKSKERKANEIRDLARKTLEYYGIVDEEKLEVFIRQITINDLLKFLKSRQILGYKRDDDSNDYPSATSRVMVAIRKIFGIAFETNRGLYLKNKKKEKIVKIKDSVTLLLNYYGIIDGEKINEVCNQISESSLNIYLTSIGLISYASLNTNDEKLNKNHIKEVKLILKKVCGLSFANSRDKLRDAKKTRIFSNVEKLLHYYGITDEEKINEICDQIKETDLNIFLEKIGLILETTENTNIKSVSAISVACYRVRTVLKKVCGLEFENSREKIEVSNEDIEEFTRFFYNNGITDSQIIKSMIRVIGGKGLKIFISEVAAESPYEENKNEKQRIYYHVRRAQSIIKEKTGMTILTTRQRNISQRKIEKEINIIKFQLDEDQIEKLICLIRKSKDIKRTMALSLILSLANRNDVSYSDLATALNISKNSAKMGFLLALQEVKDVVEIEYPGDEYSGGRCKKSKKEEQ